MQQYAPQSFVASAGWLITGCSCWSCQDPDAHHVAPDLHPQRGTRHAEPSARIEQLVERDRAAEAILGRFKRSVATNLRVAIP